jgi:hypothetical protein
MFMLAMVFAIPGAFALLVWSSYRTEARRRARGESIDTPGALRWGEGDVGDLVKK